MARRSTTYGTGRIFNTHYKNSAGKLKWSKRYSIAYCKDGVEVREATGKTLYSEALAILKDRLAGKLPNVPTETAQMFDIERLIELVEADYAENGRRGLRKLQKVRFPPLRAYFAGRDLGLLKRRHLLGYRKHRLGQIIPKGKKNAGQHYSSASVNRDLSILSHGLQLGVEHEHIEFYPRLKKLKEAPPRSGFFERADFEAVRSHMDKWWHELFELAYITGWRVDNELCPMQWSQVDFQNRILRLEPGTTKNDEGRNFGFTPALERALKDQRRRVEKLQQTEGKIIPWVFPRKHSLLPLTSAYKPFKAAAIAAGRPEALQHDFRRTAIRNLELAGVDRATAKMMVGHKTDSVYDRYNIVDKRRLDAASEKLAAFEKATRKKAG